MSSDTTSADLRDTLTKLTLATERLLRAPDLTHDNLAQETVEAANLARKAVAKAREELR